MAAIDARLQYIDVEFKLEFENPFIFHTLPTINFRSILGAQLHNITCIAKQNKCKDCQFNKSCAYAIIFETILDKTTDCLPGRDRGSHPFRLINDHTVSSNQTITTYTIRVQLYGFAIQYLPYIFYALQRAGERGLFKEKAKYKITHIILNNNNILKSDGNIKTNFTPNQWQYTPYTPQSNTYKILMSTPLRFKTEGKYTTNFSTQHFFLCLNRRLLTLSNLYGTFQTDIPYDFSNTVTMQNTSLYWKSYIYHSQRQEKIIKLGGVMGTLNLKGTFNEYELNLLNFASIFGAGKNTNFGFGNIIIT